ncbi:MAG TPA: nitrous oxide reductase accessory protein NosL [Chitinophagales bacterium]|nr:nitrous oxide reductase accessory protein NosL [Chitinophagales bacterium]
MNKLSRIILVVISLAMIPSFWLPLWKIHLDAPQYPEGLVMFIGQKHLTGDVDIINGLNHYIGMKHITEEQFPELKYITWLVLGVIISGLLLAAIGRRWLFAGWYFIFLSIAAFGIYRFWHWEYIYGHTLDPNAAIKIEGMSYQPPLIGCKQLLNFTACSFPSWGGILIMSMGTISFFILIYEFFINMQQKKRSADANKLLSALVALLLFSACSSQPQPINYGSDECALCKMGIIDQKFGAEIVTKKGKTFKFDSGECMVNFVRNGNVKEPDVASYWIADALQPGILINASKAFYLHTENFPSPMGGNISSFLTKEELQQFKQQYVGDEWSWEDVKAKVR